jgi:hypothetical protein
MTPLFKKLNFKGQKEICIINAPAEFDQEIEVMRAETIINESLRDCKKADFILAFVKTEKEIEAFAAALQKKSEGDPVIWFAYPKKTSKKYQVDINRDSGWDSLRKSGLDTVRAVSIDDDWSALRFRKKEFIKK